MQLSLSEFCVIQRVLRFFPVLSPVSGLSGLPMPEAPSYVHPAVLDGRSAVACSLQSAIAGLNSPTRLEDDSNLWWNVLK